ncbi:Bor/Iss family lipoprotein [Sphingobacterium suaedae]|uniref:Bor/Iss family lipoprotein n=1 Tax=Sphingobacterium suaedae TaxID=1686402 RepID=A0ABW5KM06_9SPHI
MSLRTICFGLFFLLLLSGCQLWLDAQQGVRALDTSLILRRHYTVYGAVSVNESDKPRRGDRSPKTAQFRTQTFTDGILSAITLGMYVPEGGCIRTP